MASRLIHYIIANQIVNETKIDNINRFLLGSLLPDLSSHDDGSYDNAHFGERLITKNIKGINWITYEKKYWNKMKEDSLYLGYYCHLIMDCLWFSMVVDPYVRKGQKSEREQLYQKGYRDYWRLNYILTREFSLKHQLCVDEDINIQEINCKQISNLVDTLKLDIECKDYASKEDMELYPYEVIEQYIKFATEVCKKELFAFENGEEHISPVDYYVII